MSAGREDRQRFLKLNRKAIDIKEFFFKLGLTDFKDFFSSKQHYTNEKAKEYRRKYM